MLPLFVHRSDRKRRLCKHSQFTQVILHPVGCGLFYATIKASIKRASPHWLWWWMGSFSLPASQALHDISFSFSFFFQHSSFTLLDGTRCQIMKQHKLVSCWWLRIHHSDSRGDGFLGRSRNTKKLRQKSCRIIRCVWFFWVRTMIHDWNPVNFVFTSLSSLPRLREFVLRFRFHTLAEASCRAADGARVTKFHSFRRNIRSLDRRRVRLAKLFPRRRIKLLRTFLANSRRFIEP